MIPFCQYQPSPEMLSATLPEAQNYLQHTAPKEDIEPTTLTPLAFARAQEPYDLFARTKEVVSNSQKLSYE
jgi:hypothetical protein